MSANRYNIHDRARQMVAQSGRPMSMSEAYAELARRAAAKRRSLGMVYLKRSTAEHFATIETPQGGDAWHKQPRGIRLPYRDD